MSNEINVKIGEYEVKYVLIAKEEYANLLY